MRTLWKWHFPAVDVTKSLSRLMERLASEGQRQAAASVRGHLALYEQKRDLITLGAYSPGSDARLDAVLSRIERIEKFLRQGSCGPCAMDDSLQQLAALV